MAEEIQLKYQKVDETAFAPSKGTPESIGFDLRSPIDFEINSGEWQVIDLKIRLELPDESYGRLAPRSGLSLQGVQVLAGVIDKDYTGNIKVVLMNHSKNKLDFKRGQKIVQLIVERAFYPTLTEVRCIEKQSQRNMQGFGSTD